MTGPIVHPEKQCLLNIESSIRYAVRSLPDATEETLIHGIEQAVRKELHLRSCSGLNYLLQRVSVQSRGVALITLENSNGHQILLRVKLNWVLHELFKIETRRDFSV